MAAGKMYLVAKAGKKITIKKKAPMKKVPKKIKSYVHRAIDASHEDKIDVFALTYGDHANPWVNQTFQYTSLNTGIAQGTGPNQRVGDAIRIKKIELSIEFVKYWDYANTEAHGFRPESSFRVFLINKKIPNGTLADPTQYLVKSGSTSYQTALYNDYWLKNYQILMDKKFVIRNSDYMNYLPTTNVTYHSVVQTLKKTISWKKGIRVQYCGNTGLIADIVRNYFSVMAVWTGLNDATTIPGALPQTLNIMGKIHYEDA